MATFLYEKFLRALVSWTDAGLAAAIDLKTDTIRAFLVDANGGAPYAPDSVNDQFLAAIDPTARKGGAAGATGVSDGVALGTKTTGAAGVFDAADVTFTAVASVTAEYVVLYKDTGDAATAPLICLIDSTGATGLPVASGGGDVIVRWLNSGNRIFKP